MSQNVPPAEQMPHTIGRYQVQESVGYGAMGAVYKAFDPLIKRTLAIKTIRLDIPRGSPQYKSFIERFYHEARISGTLSHPNIVTLFDIGEENGLPFLAMEFVQGETISSMLEKGLRFAPEKVISLVSQVASAVDYAHSRGVIHRDIKPSNLILADGERVKITDFGIAKLMDAEMTQSGTLLGTPSYMSPEQAMGEKLDGRSDIFSLGVCAFEMLSGEQPFPGTNVTSILYKLVHVDPIEPANLEMHGLVPQKWHEVFGKVLAKKPDDRYQTATAFVQDLEYCLGSWFAAMGGETLAEGRSRGVSVTAASLMESTASLTESTASLPGLPLPPARPGEKTNPPEPAVAKTTPLPVPSPGAPGPAKAAPPPPAAVVADGPEVLETVRMKTPDEEPETLRVTAPPPPPAAASPPAVAPPEAKKAEGKPSKKEEHPKPADSGAGATMVLDPAKLSSPTPKEPVGEAPLVEMTMPMNSPDLTMKAPAPEMTVKTPMPVAAAHASSQAGPIPSAPPAPAPPAAATSPGPPAAKPSAAKPAAKPAAPPPPPPAPPRAPSAAVKAATPPEAAPTGPLPVVRPEAVRKGPPVLLLAAGGAALFLALVIGGGIWVWRARMSATATPAPPPSPLAEATPTAGPTEAPPPPFAGTLHVETQPAGANVTVNGEAKGKAPLDLSGLPAGSYEVKLELRGYEPRTENVAVGPEAPAGELKIALTRAAPVMGTLDVFSTPLGANVLMDGASIGQTPITDQRVKPGSHRFEVTKEGFEPFAGSLKVEPGKKARLDVPLKGIARAIPTPVARTPEPVDTGRIYQNVSTEVDTLARKLSGPSAEYPRLAPRLKSGDSVSVTISFVVNEDGDVIDPKVVESGGKILDDAVLSTVRQWKYSPAVKRGAKVKVRVSFKQTFRAG